MAQTPEGKVKSAVKKLLKSYGEEVKYDMPVPFGYGKSTVDFIGVHNGLAFAIETKAPGETPTALQEEFLLEWQRAGGASFVIADAARAALLPLKRWLDSKAYEPLSFPPQPLL